MAKKKSRAKYTSKGLRRNVASKRRDPEPTVADTFINKWNAFLKGHKVFYTIPNPNPDERNKKFIRVEAKTLYGDYRKYR